MLRECNGDVIAVKCRTKSREKKNTVTVITVGTECSSRQ